MHMRHVLTVVALGCVLTIGPLAKYPAKYPTKELALSYLAGRVRVARFGDPSGVGAPGGPLSSLNTKGGAS